MKTMRSSTELEEDGERVDLEGGVEGGDGAGGVDDVELVERREAGGEGSEDGQPAERLAGLAGRDERLGHHDEDAGEGEDEFREQGEEVGGH
jgi:hypothetical protein